LPFFGQATVQPQAGTLNRVFQQPDMRTTWLGKSMKSRRRESKKTKGFLKAFGMQT